MTIKKLIDELKKYPNDYTVNTYYVDSDGDTIWNNISIKVLYSKKAILL